MNNQFKQMFNKTSPFIVSVVFSFFFLLIMSFSTSPIYLNEGMDSCIFKTIGLAITKGKIPYVDIFDHKGPILFFIDALGELLGGRNGIFILQVLSLSFVSFLWYKIARMYISRLKSYVVISAVFFLLMAFISEGNQCEEWMLLYSTISLFIAIGVFKRFQSSSNIVVELKEGVLNGICFAMMFWIRPNDAVIYSITLIAGLGFFLLVNKQYKQIFDICTYFFIGVLLVTIPIVLYFVSHNAFSELIYGTIGYNLQYVGDSNYSFRGDLVIKRLIIFLPFIFLIIKQLSRRDLLLYYSVPVISLSYFFTGWNPFNHYYIMLVPLYLLFLCESMVLLENYINQRLRANLIWLCVFIVVFVGSLTFGKSDVLASCYVQGRDRILAIVSRQENIKEFYETTEKLFDCIPISDKDSVYNFNLGYSGNRPLDISPFSVFYHCDVIQCNPMTFAKSDFLLQKNDVANIKPKWILCDKNRIIDERDSEYSYIAKNYIVEYPDASSEYPVLLLKRIDIIDMVK